MIHSKTQVVSRVPQDKLIRLEALTDIREAARQRGKTVVWTSGCFDLMHIGHVRSLQAAKTLGGLLIVGVNSDAAVRQLKGIGRPIYPVEVRAELLCSLSCVDYVVEFTELTPAQALSLLRPDVHCKGADYAWSSDKPLPEESVVRSYGGRIEFLPLMPGISTSLLIQTIQNLPPSNHESD